MTNYLLYGVIGMLAVVALLQLLLVLRKDTAVRTAITSLKDSSAQTEQALRDELARVLIEAREFRDDVSGKFAGLMKLMVPASTVTKSIDEKLDRVREVVEQRLTSLQEDSAHRLDRAGEQTLAVANGQRQDSAQAVEKVKAAIFAMLDQYTKYQNQTLHQSLVEQTNQQRANLTAVVDRLTRLIETTEQKLTAYRAEADARMKRIQSEVDVVSKFSAATHAFGAALATEFNGAHEENRIPSR